MSLSTIKMSLLDATYVLFQWCNTKISELLSDDDGWIMGLCIYNMYVHDMVTLVLSEYKGEDQKWLREHVLRV